MKPYFELVFEENSDIHVTPLFSDEEIETRHKDYEVLTAKKFDYNFRYKAFEVVELIYFGEIRKIQYNFCIDPFCPNFGLSQERTSSEGRPHSRYTFKAAKVNKRKGIVGANASTLRCSSKFNTSGAVYEHESILMSNWSIAFEIRRLASINMIQSVINHYDFHRDSCKSKSTPFDSPTAFYKRGKSSSKSQKFQCKECRKITNVKPSADENFSYGQKRNDVLLQFCQCIMSRVPVKKTCEILHMSPSTYYSKLNWLYRKCLEFNHRYETPNLKNIQFNQLWLNPDFLQYNLNNIKQRGVGNISIHSREKHKPIDRMTFILATTDLKSKYAFRADVAYDPNASLDEIEADTLLYHCDHTYSYLRKNERYKQSYAPIAPDKNSANNQTITSRRI